MTFTHDTTDALTAAAALVNTASDGDTLRTLADLHRFLDEHGWTGGRGGDRAELEAVRELRARLRRLWHLEEGQLVELVNAILAEAAAVPQLVDHDDFGWHIHAVPQDAPLATRMAVEAAMALRRRRPHRRAGPAQDLCRRGLRGRRGRPLPQPVAPVLRVRLRQPRERPGLPGPTQGRRRSP